MRNPRWTWTAALAAMGLAASSPWIDAQTNRGLEPGANPNVSPMDAAGVQIAPVGKSSATARKPAAPVMDPGDAAMLRSRSARTVLRNGIDYIKYQQYDKALVYLREAERRKDQLNPAEVTSLRQGIEAAQEGLRAPTSLAGYAKTRRPQAGSFAIAAKSPAVAPSDSSMLPASAEVPIQEPQAVAQPVVRTALEPIPPEALAKALPTASELARSKSAASARRQYESAGNSGGSEPLPPLSAPVSLTQPLKARESESVASTEAVAPEQAPVMEPVAARLPEKVTNAPEPLPGSPSARSSVAQQSAATLDKSVSTVTDQSKPSHQETPSLPTLSVPPGAVDESESAAPETLPPLPIARSQPAMKLESVKAEVKSTVPVVETPALPAVNADDEPIDDQPAKTNPADSKPSLPALPPLETAEVKAKVQEKTETVEASAEPNLPRPLAKQESEPSLPALPAAVEVAQAPLESKVVAKLESEPSLAALPVANAIEKAAEAPMAVELEVKPATVQLAAEAPVASEKPLQEVGGIPVLTPLADDEEPAAAPAKPVQAERIAAKLVDEAPKPLAGDSLPALPDAPASVKPAAPADDLPPLPPIPSLDQAPLKVEEPAKPADKPVAESAPTLPVAASTAIPEPAGDLPPLPVGTSNTPDTPPVPPVAPVQAEPTPERVARAEANPAAAATSDNLPPLPAEEVAKTVTPSPSSPDGDPEIGKITDKYLGGLSFERRREIEQMARIQGGRTGSTPGLSPLGVQPPEEAEAAGSRPSLPGANSNMNAMDDPLVRLELPRAPSPAEARPIRAILLPEQFDSLKPRQFDPRRKMWASAAVAHYPLYFQDPSLERYGVSVEQRLGRAGRKLTYAIDDPKESKLRNQIASPMISSGLFALQIATFPFRAIADPPWESEYDLGYYRPGDVVPEDTVVVPWKGVGPLFKGNKY